MLYAQMDDRKMSWPLQWEKCQDMHKYLNKMAWGYQLMMERRMFNNVQYPEYKCSLIRWVQEIPTAQHTQTNLPKKTREVLLETTDPAQMEAALFMLINEVEAEHKAARDRVSMVP